MSEPVYYPLLQYVNNAQQEFQTKVREIHGGLESDWTIAATNALKQKNAVHVVFGRHEQDRKNTNEVYHRRDVRSTFCVSSGETGLANG